MMRISIAVSALVVACSLAVPAFAQSEDKGVPVVKAPYHLPVFTNDLLTVIKIWIPPGRNTGYHIHAEDSISVNLSPAIQTNQNLGSSEITRGEPAQRGRILYTPYSKGPPRTHKATNVGETPFHNVSFLFRKPAGQFTPGTRNVAGYTQVLDNERVRAWRLALDPGQSAPAITQNAPGLRVVLDGGEIAESIPGAADRGWMLASGEFYWQDAGVTRGIKNIGTTRIDIVEFELK